MSDRTETEETGAGIIAEMREGPIPRHQHDRELLHHYADRLEAALVRECGDVVKLREALEKIAHYTDSRVAMDDPGCADGYILADIAKTALTTLRNCVAKVFVLVKEAAFASETDRYEVFGSFRAANEWMRRDFGAQQREEERFDRMGVMGDDPAFFRDQPAPSSASDSAVLHLGESRSVRWRIYEKELITKGGVK